MSNKKKSKGRLQQYLGWPILFAVAIAVVNVILFFVDQTAGFVMLPLTLAGAVAAGLLRRPRSRPSASIAASATSVATSRKRTPFAA